MKAKKAFNKIKTEKQAKRAEDYINHCLMFDDADLVALSKLADDVLAFRQTQELKDKLNTYIEKTS